MKKDFSDHFIEALNNSNLTQEELTQMVGLAKNTITRWKKEIPDTVHKFLELSLILGIDYKYSQSNETNYNNITNLLDKLDERELIKLEGYIEDKVEDILRRRVTSSSSRNTG